MSTKMECYTCNGRGWVEGVKAVCCGATISWECGGSGCTGPIPEQTQEACPDCGGSGYNMPPKKDIADDISKSNARQSEFYRARENEPWFAYSEDD